MDIINLIRSVKCREAIWNRQHPQYKDREYSMYLWSQVATEVGVDVETARYKWRGLRDTFRVQLRKLNQPTQLKSRGQSPLKWEYFDEMFFVKDQIYIDVNRRKYCGNSSDGIIDNFHCKEEDYDEEEDDDDDDDDMEINIEDSQEYQGPAAFCITEVTEDTDTLLEFNYDGNSLADELVSRVSEEENTYFDKMSNNQSLQKKLRSLQDDNYCFLMSILPQLKSLPNKQKLYIRIKIQEMLLAEVLNLESQE